MRFVQGKRGGGGSITDDNVAEAVIDFCNAMEAAIVNLKRQLGRRNGQAESVQPPNTSTSDAIKWESREGSKGPFERSEDVDNPQFKLLLKDLAAHQGKLTRNGLFYWTFQNGSTVGRKKAKYEKKA